VKRRGLLLTFEGVEGSGKTTQAQLLSSSLSELGYECILTRDPGGTPIGEAIRELLLSPKYEEMDALTELFLYLASRGQLIRDVVRPGLEAGKLVISDRFSLSSLVYQASARGLKSALVARLDRLITDQIKPDLVILLDLPVTLGLARASSDRLAREPLDFHERVRQAYLASARRAPKRVRVFDGKRSISELNEAIKSMVIEFLRSKGVG
jgi:dTMP kinase